MKKAKKSNLETVKDPLFVLGPRNGVSDGNGVRPEHFTDISTHENVSLYYETAGIATRYAAFFIDMLIRIAGWLLIAAVVYFAYIRDFIFGEKELDFSWDFFDKIGMVVLIVYISIFFVRLLYYILFETFMRGRTPGKRAMGITVISVSGEAPTASQIAVRNVMRFFHLIPGGELADGIVAICSKKAQRAGDMVAGTMVIKVRKMAGFELPEKAENSDENVNAEIDVLNQTAVMEQMEKDEADFLAEMKEKLRREAAAAGIENGAVGEAAAAAATASLSSDAPAAPASSAAPASADNAAMPLMGVVPPGGFLTLGETIRLKDYLLIREKFLLRNEYDEKYARILLRKSGAAIPERMTAANIQKYIQDVYNYHANLWNAGKGGAVNGVNN